jgi:hypothetical protein
VLVEGKTEEELPEQVIGCIQLQGFDVEKAVSSS